MRFLKAITNLCSNNCLKLFILLLPIICAVNVSTNSAHYHLVFLTTTTIAATTKIKSTTIACNINYLNCLNYYIQLSTNNDIAYFVQNIINSTNNKNNDTNISNVRATNDNNNFNISRATLAITLTFPWNSSGDSNNRRRRRTTDQQNHNNDSINNSNCITQYYSYLLELLVCMLAATCIEIVPLISKHAQNLLVVCWRQLQHFYWRLYCSVCCRRGATCNKLRWLKSHYHTTDGGVSVGGAPTDQQIGRYVAGLNGDAKQIQQLQQLCRHHQLTIIALLTSRIFAILAAETFIIENSTFSAVKDVGTTKKLTQLLLPTGELIVLLLKYYEYQSNKKLEHKKLEHKKLEQKKLQMHQQQHTQHSHLICLDGTNCRTYSNNSSRHSNSNNISSSRNYKRCSQHCGNMYQQQQYADSDIIDKHAQQKNYFKKLLLLAQGLMLFYTYNKNSSRRNNNRNCGSSKTNCDNDKVYVCINNNSKTTSSSNTTQYYEFAAKSTTTTDKRVTTKLLGRLTTTTKTCQRKYHQNVYQRRSNNKQKRMHQYSINLNKKPNNNKNKRSKKRCSNISKSPYYEQPNYEQQQSIPTTSPTSATSAQQQPYQLYARQYYNYMCCCCCCNINSIDNNYKSIGCCCCCRLLTCCCCCCCWCCCCCCYYCYYCCCRCYHCHQCFSVYYYCCQRFIHIHYQSNLISKVNDCNASNKNKKNNCYPNHNNSYNANNSSFGNTTNAKTNQYATMRCNEKQQHTQQQSQKRHHQKSFLYKQRQQFYNSNIFCFKCFADFITVATCPNNNNSNSSSKIQHFCKGTYQKIFIIPSYYYRCFITLLRIIPKNTTHTQNQQQQQQQHQHQSHRLIAVAVRHNCSQMTFCIANDQQLKTNNLCKIFCNNRKRHRRRRRRRRRRLLNNQEQQQQQQQLPQQQQPLIPEPHRISDKRKKNKQLSLWQQIRSFKKLLSLNAFKAIRKTISLSATTSSSLLSLSTTSSLSSTTTTTAISITTTTASEIKLRPEPTRIYKRRTAKPNLVWLFIGLVWFEGPKMVSCTVSSNSSGQQQQVTHHAQQQQQHQQTVNTTTAAATTTVTLPQDTTTHTKTNTLKSTYNLVYNNNNHHNSNTNKKRNSNNNSNNNSNKYNNKKNNNNKNHPNRNDNNSSNVSYSSPYNNDNRRNCAHQAKHLCYHFKHQRHQQNQQQQQSQVASFKSTKHKTGSNSKTTTTIKPERLHSMISDKSPAFTSTETTSSNAKVVTATNSMLLEAAYAKEQESSTQSDRVRLESIKRQILSKLGLTRKPNVSHPLPKQFIWDTIYRADGITGVSDFHNDFSENHSDQLFRVLTASASHSSSASPINVLYKHARVKNSNNSNNNKNNKFYNKNNNTNNNNNSNNNNNKNNDNNNNTNNKNYKSNKSNPNFISNNNSKDNKNNRKKDEVYSSKNGVLDTNYYVYTDNAINYTNALHHYQRQRSQEQQQQITKYKNHLQKIHNRNSKLTYRTGINNGGGSSISSIYKDDNSGDNENDENGTMVDADGVRKLADIMMQHQFIPNQDRLESEDFFGSTQEIITFAEKGKMYKEHRLVEFLPQNQKIPNQKLYVRNAEIHIRIERLLPNSAKLMTSADKYKNRIYQDKTKLNIWIFQLLEKNYTQKGFDQVARFCASFTVDTKRLGWQKFDLTDTVQKWYTRTLNDKLRLLIDCSGCGQQYVLHLFENPNQQQQQHNSQYQQQQQQGKQQLQQLGESNSINDKPSVDKTSFNMTTTDDTVANWMKQRHDSSLFTKSNNYSSNRNTDSTSNSTDPQSLPNYRHKIPTAVKIPDCNRKPTTSITTTITEFYHLEEQKQHPEQQQQSELQSQNLNPNRPFLVLHTEPKRVRRVRRRAIDCMGAMHGQCCKESFYVSFKALGWDDWIIAPRGYFANYCRGDCTGPFRTPDTFQTFHAHFIEEYRKIGLLNGMQPCCAPIKFSSMSLIYYGDDGIIKRDLPKMVVDECGCP